MTDNLSDYHLERLGPHGGDLASIPLRLGANTIGRLTSNNIVLSSKYASRSHCTICVTETETGHVTVKNVVATNGVFINGAQKLNRDADICLNINDIIGIGCDTTNEEISDEACFIFQLKRNKIEENGADDIIVLADSDEEEEYKVLEQYSQFNLSEMKQEWMDSEVVVEEYSHSRSKLTANSTRNNHQYPPPRIQKLKFTIPLKNINAAPTIQITDAATAHNVSVNNSKKTSEASTTVPTEVVHSRISNRRSTLVPSSTLAASSTDERSDVSNKPTEAVHLRISNRRRTFVPSSTLASGSLKRCLEIIDAPPMLKRRKSVCFMPETVKPPSKKKESESKWLSKTIPHKRNRRSKEEKEEIKSRLAAIVPSPKEKVAEPKIIRPNKKIPVKNTHTTRSDQLTDTIVKTLTTPSSKHKLNDSSLPSEICKRLPMTETDKPNKIRLRSSSLAEKEEKTATEVKLNVASECVHLNGINDVADNHSNDLPNLESNGSSATAVTIPSPVVKSILKKSNSIQKRRVTVSFAEESRFKTTRIIEPPPAASPIACDEENSDDVIHNIMSLGMVALKEVSRSSATINGKNFSYKTVAHEYPTLRHLQNVFIPLMKAELWKEIEDGYARSKNTQAAKVQLDFCVRDENHPNRYKYHTSSDMYMYTGKSRLITNLVLQILYGKEMAQPLKILVCAPSNAAVDILTKNLMEARRKYLIGDGQKKIKLVRFGVLEKMDRGVRSVSLQELTKENNQKTVLIEQKKLMECKKKKEKMVAFRNEIGVLEAKMKNVVFDEKCLLEGANVICTTLNSCCALSSKISSMDICIIDEATQCNEPTSLIPLQFGVKSLILVGDTKQLPSTVVSEIAKQYNYDQSLFQRLQKSFESANEFENPILQLTTQYRMHPDILHWPNEYFYKNCLVSDDTTNDRAWKLKPYTVFNLNFVQSTHTGQKHISNVDEAKFVRNLLDFLITKAHPKKHSYGIISEYSQQKDDLPKDLCLTHPYVTVNTIDSCQGQERDIVIISIARTRDILCGNFSSLQSHPMWTSLLDDAKNRKLYVHLPTMDDSLLAAYFEKTLTT